VAEQQKSRRHTFWPVVLLGVAGSGLAAIAGSKHWGTLPSGGGIRGISMQEAQSAATPLGTGAPALDAPAVTALALVALAAWGVALVTRGVVRRGVVLLGALAAVAAVPTAIGSLHGLPSSASLTAWPWLAFVGLALTIAAAVLAFLWAPQWPEMGRRYDAPTTGPTLPGNLEEAENIDLWKTISEGHDPTSDHD
jgi:hypothetical protein